MTKRVIIALSSDFGIALAKDWLAEGHEVIGTYRRRTPALEGLKDAGARLVECDLTDKASLARAGKELTALATGWEVLVQASGVQDPVGLFADSNFDQWEASIGANFLSPLRLVHGLLPLRDTAAANGPMVLFFAGGGTNNATLNYSAYTISKIASIKMCELLDAEMPQTRFAIVGPGWVKTKIHEATLEAGSRAGANYERTLAMLAGENCVSMERVVDCVNWAIASPRDVIGGRNISLVHDAWGDPSLDGLLRANPDFYKLRRAGNDALIAKPL